MKNFTTSMKTIGSKIASNCKTKALALTVALATVANSTFAAVSIDGTAGKEAIEGVTGVLTKYLEPIQDLCYALAAIVAILGAISVYIAMNNEEQDVKNILSLCFGFESKRKEMQTNRLNINTLRKNICFPILSEVIFKKI